MTDEKRTNWTTLIKRNIQIIMLAILTSCFSKINFESLSSKNSPLSDVDLFIKTQTNLISSGENIVITYGVKEDPDSRINSLKIYEGEYLHESLERKAGEVELSNVARGNYSFTLRGYDSNGETISISEKVTVKVESYHIKFKSGTDSIVENYIGLDPNEFRPLDNTVYSLREDNYSYGWTTAVSTPLDCSDNIYLYSLSTSDKRYICGYGYSSSTWELEIPNGNYLITTGIGRAHPYVWNGSDVLIGNNIEGVDFIEFNWNISDRYRQKTSIIEVNDGRLSIAKTSGATANSTLNFIEVVDNKGNDFQPPPIPKPIVKTLSDKTARISWDLVNDNILTSSYLIYLNGILDSEVTSTHHFITNLNPGETYNIQVASKDYSGNVSKKSEEYFITMPTNSLKASNTSTAPVIDGDILTDPAWGGITFHPFNNIYENINDSDDLNATFALMWDSTNLYIAFDITDDIIALNNGDFIEIFLEAPNTKKRDFHNKAYKLECRPLLTSCNNSNYISSTISNVVSNTTISGNNLVMEVQIPWTELGIIPNSDIELGFDIQYSDDDNDNNTFEKEGSVFWYDKYNTIWLSPADFGVIGLE